MMGVGGAGDREQAVLREAYQGDKVKETTVKGTELKQGQ